MVHLYETPVDVLVGAAKDHHAVELLEELIVLTNFLAVDRVEHAANHEELNKVYDCLSYLFDTHIAGVFTFSYLTIQAFFVDVVFEAISFAERGKSKEVKEALAY